MVGLVASGVFLIRLLPQPLRLARTGVAAGVSPLAAANGVVNAIGWTAYGLTAGLPIVWVVSAIALVLSVWTAGLLRGSYRTVDRVGGAAWLVTVAAAAAFGRLGLVLAASVALTMGPQVVMSLRRNDLRGIAPAALWIGLLDAAAWGAYGVVIGDAPLISYAIVLSSSSLIVLGRVAITSRRAPVPAMMPQAASAVS